MLQYMCVKVKMVWMASFQLCRFLDSIHTRRSVPRTKAKLLPRKTRIEFLTTGSVSWAKMTQKALDLMKGRRKREGAGISIRACEIKLRTACIKWKDRLYYMLSCHYTVGNFRYPFCTGWGQGSQNSNHSKTNWNNSSTEPLDQWHCNPIMVADCEARNSVIER